MSLAGRGQDPVHRSREAGLYTEEGQSPVKREEGPVQAGGGCTVKFNASLVMVICDPQPPMDRHDFKHYLPATSLTGGKKEARQQINILFLVRMTLVIAFGFLSQNFERWQGRSKSTL